MVVYFAYWSLPEDNGFAQPEYLSFRSFCREIMRLGLLGIRLQLRKGCGKSGLQVRMQMIARNLFTFET
jgi:hypothetical protein